MLSSKFPMESRPENGYGASVAVERRVSHELVIQGRVNGFPDLKIVVSFEDFLRAVAQRAVTVEHVRAACLEKFLVIAGSPTHDAGKAKGVVGPTPGPAFDAHA